MSTTEMMQRAGKTSQRMRATFVGAYYLLTLLACAFVFFFRGGQAFGVHLITSVFFIAITAFFYGLSKPGLSKPGLSKPGLSKSGLSKSGKKQEGD